MAGWSDSPKVVVLAAMAALAGCASPDAQWAKDDTPRSEVDQALADCKYQAEAATVNIGSNNRPATFGDAISQGVASGVVRGMDEAELTESCMKAKGYKR